jgi:hypothetical protein
MTISCQAETSFQKLPRGLDFILNPCDFQAKERFPSLV